MEYKQNDYELVYMIGEHDEDALQILLEKYDYVIKNWAYYYWNKFNKYSISVDDLIQEGKIGLYIASKKYTESKDVKFYTFALICIKRIMMNYVTSHTRVKNLVYANQVPIENHENELFYDENPLDMIENFEFQKKIIEFKNSLDFLDANIFELRYNLFSYNDIATLLDINKKKVDNSLVKSKAKLKKFLLENDFLI